MTIPMGEQGVMPVTSESSLPSLSAPLSALTLAEKRTALLLRIHAAREGTAEVGRKLAADLESFDRTRRSFIAGLKLAQATIAAAGLVWSLNACLHPASPIGRRSRLFTVGFSMLSTLRGLQRVSALWRSQANSQGAPRWQSPRGQAPRGQTPTTQQINQG